MPTREQLVSLFFFFIREFTFYYNPSFTPHYYLIATPATKFLSFSSSMNSEKLWWSNNHGWKHHWIPKVESWMVMHLGVTCSNYFFGECWRFNLKMASYESTLSMILFNFVTLDCYFRYWNSYFCFLRTDSQNQNLGVSF